ncbi:AAA family ATPase [Actinomycetospora corticicola]|uniref:ATPase AAA-type core domain-containing protein n=1 Tax=Actinomycetospora corticicola TaxID=663602 RepID=A0A7Y9J883_9PSEU|nr:AAA family ATPase [Actinomycetospora corticicola]NYD39175.1 hypothetical protein [Actinomycetospora corticicola]
MNWDPDYFVRVGSGALPVTGPDQANVEFYEGDVATDVERVKKAFYFRTAYRIEADFSSAGGVPRMGALVSDPRFSRMSETDAAVSQNYNRIIEEAVRELFDASKVQTTEDIRRALLADITDSMRNIFGELEVENISDPLGGGSFYFSKNESRRWHYKNLSGGERAAFDLLLDMAVKKRGYDDTIYCIDEPELHLNTRVQGALLVELMRLLPANCQLWIASHSIGMMKKARERAEQLGDVAFLDFESFNPAQVGQVLKPAKVDRAFWQRTLSVALDEIADLVAPRTLVLVEGKPGWTDGATRRANVSFDARCYENIFSSVKPDVVFMSVGGSADVEDDTLHLTETTPIISRATQVLRVIDRDDRSEKQREEYRQDGVRVLRRRDLENYLFGDGVIRAYCANVGHSEIADSIIELRDALLVKRVEDGVGSGDDVKSVSGELFTRMTTGLGLTQQGTKFAWMRDTLAPLIQPGTQEYEELDADLFG